MSALAIDINDAGIAIASAAGLLAVEPGFALVDRQRIVTGSPARSQARLKPRQTSNRFWHALTLEPGSAGTDVAKSAAELAFAQLHALWQPVAGGVTAVFVVVPGCYGTEQLGLLLGLAQECGMPVRALVDVAAAASVRPYPDRQLMYVDAGLHRITVTLLEQGNDVRVRTEHALTQTGLAGLMDGFARRIAEAFVLATRFDPLHHAETEQLLYDRLPAWLGELHTAERLELVLPYRNDEFRVTIERDAVLSSATGLYRAITQLISQYREPGNGLVVQLSDRLAALPGLVVELARLDDAYVECLPVGHAANRVLQAKELATAGSDHVKLLKRLLWREPPAELEPRPTKAPRKPVAAANEQPPTHVLYRGIVYGIGPKGLLIGRETVPGRRVLVVDDQQSGVSRTHCELVQRDGELRLADLSRYGTFVNERRIEGSVVLERGDVVRIGSPGAEFHIAEMETS